MTKRRIHAEPIRHWTPEEDAVVRRLFPHNATVSLLSELPGRTMTSIRARARLLGLQKTPEFLASPASGRLDGVRGTATRFPKGNVPWTAGKKGYKPGGRAPETQFKPGTMPHNHVPVGTKRKASIGQWKVKVAEPNQWRFVHRMNWEETNGPIPPGMVLAFKDRNQDNTDLSNLELVKRSEIMSRNTLHNYPQPIPQLIQLRAAVVRKINRRRQSA